MGSRHPPENATVDHKKACSEGGSNAVENLQWVLKTVNKAKGAMSVEEFVSMCCHVADHARAGSAGSLVGSRGSETENSAAD